MVTGRGDGGEDGDVGRGGGSVLRVGEEDEEARSGRRVGATGAGGAATSGVRGDEESPDPDRIGGA